MMRYIAPNLVTATAMFFGLLSMIAAYEGRYIDASWLILWAVLFDRMDGLVARSLKATSEFGVQMDSFADFLNFGIAPAFLIYSALSSTPGLPFASGRDHTLLLVAVVMWVFASTFRLARFNVVTEETKDHRIFFGIPTTLAAGTMVNWFLVCLKYTDPASVLSNRAAFFEGHLFGDLAFSPHVWKYFPLIMVCGSLLMISNVRMPKLATFRNKWVTILVMALTFAAIFCILTRKFPEYTVLLPTTWLILWLVWGHFAPNLRQLHSPPLFPVRSSLPAHEDKPANASSR